MLEVQTLSGQVDACIRVDDEIEARPTATARFDAAKREQLAAVTDAKQQLEHRISAVNELPKPSQLTPQEMESLSSAENRARMALERLSKKCAALEATIAHENELRQQRRRSLQQTVDDLMSTFNVMNAAETAKCVLTASNQAAVFKRLQDETASARQDIQREIDAEEEETEAKAAIPSIEKERQESVEELKPLAEQLALLDTNIANQLDELEGTVAAYNRANAIKVSVQETFNNVKSDFMALKDSKTTTTEQAIQNLVNLEVRTDAIDEEIQNLTVIYKQISSIEDPCANEINAIMTANVALKKQISAEKFIKIDVAKCAEEVNRLKDEINEKLNIAKQEIAKVETIDNDAKTTGKQLDESINLLENIVDPLLVAVEETLAAFPLPTSEKEMPETEIEEFKNITQNELEDISQHFNSLQQSMLDRKNVLEKFEGELFRVEERLAQIDINVDERNRRISTAEQLDLDQDENNIIAMEANTSEIAAKLIELESMCDELYPMEDPMVRLQHAREKAEQTNIELDALKKDAQERHQRVQRAASEEIAKSVLLGSVRDAISETLDEIKRQIDVAEAVDANVDATDAEYHDALNGIGRLTRPFFDAVAEKIALLEDGVSASTSDPISSESVEIQQAVKECVTRSKEMISVLSESLERKHALLQHARTEMYKVAMSLEQIDSTLSEIENAETLGGVIPENETEQQRLLSEMKDKCANLHATIERLEERGSEIAQQQDISTTLPYSIIVQLKGANKEVTANEKRITQQKEAIDKKRHWHTELSSLVDSISRIEVEVLPTLLEHVGMNISAQQPTTSNNFEAEKNCADDLVGDKIPLLNARLMELQQTTPFGNQQIEKFAEIRGRLQKLKIDADSLHNDIGDCNRLVSSVTPKLSEINAKFEAISQRTPSALSDATLSQIDEQIEAVTEQHKALLNLLANQLSATAPTASELMGQKTKLSTVHANLRNYARQQQMQLLTKLQTLNAVKDRRETALAHYISDRTETLASLERFGAALEALIKDEGDEFDVRRQELSALHAEVVELKQRWLFVPTMELAAAGNEYDCKLRRSELCSLKTAFDSLLQQIETECKRIESTEAETKKQTVAKAECKALIDKHVELIKNVCTFCSHFQKIR